MKISTSAHRCDREFVQNLHWKCCRDLYIGRVLARGDDFELESLERFVTRPLLLLGERMQLLVPFFVLLCLFLLSSATTRELLCLDEQKSGCFSLMNSQPDSVELYLDRPLWVRTLSDVGPFVRPPMVVLC